MYFSFNTIQYYMQMSNRQIRSREFIVGIDQVVQLITADNSDSSDGDDPIDEEDIVFLEEATQETGSENKVLVTIDDARADTQIPIDSFPLDYIFSWQKITSGSNTVDIPVCTLSGAVNLKYDHEPQPADVFLDVTDLNTLLESVIVQSQLYVQQKGKVFQIDLEEMKAFIGITSFMGYHVVPCLRDYWSKDPGLGINMVANVMPRDRFFEIRTALHFVDNEQPHDTKDKAWKMRPVINHFNNSFSHAVSPTAQQAIDEHVVKFKGQHAMKQYMPMKPIKRGFKMWCRNDSATGYLFQFDMYGGKQERNVGSLGENVIIQLSRSLVGTNVRLFFNNFFTSPALVHKLQQEKIFCCGTVRQNRKSMPKNF